MTECGQPHQSIARGRCNRVRTGALQPAFMLSRPFSQSTNAPLSFYEVGWRDGAPVVVGRVMSYSLLHTKAREAMRAGNLPLRSPDRLWGGPATGDRCAVCGDSTTPGEIALEIEFTRASEAGRTSYHVHPRCFAIYNRELERFRGADNVGTQHTAESVDHNITTGG
jgi:hypothetical protein